MIHRTPLTRRKTIRALGAGMATSLAGCTIEVGDTSDDQRTPTPAPASGEAEVASRADSLLNQSIPDPVDVFSGEEFSVFENDDRVRGEVKIDTTAGTIAFRSSDVNGITLLAGYIAADDLESEDWGVGDINDADKFVTGLAGESGMQLSFTPGTFHGVALRAVNGISLIVDGETVSEPRSLIRYVPDKGMIASQTPRNVPAPGDLADVYPILEDYEVEDPETVVKVDWKAELFESVDYPGEDDQIESDPGELWLILAGVAENIGNEQTRFNFYSIALEEEGENQDPRRFGYKIEQPVQTLRPGESFQSWVAYIIPEGERPLRMVYKTPQEHNVLFELNKDVDSGLTGTKP